VNNISDSLENNSLDNHRELADPDWFFMFFEPPIIAELSIRMPVAHPHWSVCSTWWRLGFEAERRQAMNLAPLQTVAIKFINQPRLIICSFGNCLQQGCEIQILLQH
jgi:hypothetical protein